MSKLTVRDISEVPAPPTIVLSRKAQLWASFQGFNTDQIRGVRDSYRAYVGNNPWFKYYRTDEIDLIKSALTLALHGGTPQRPIREKKEA